MKQMPGSSSIACRDPNLRPKQPNKTQWDPSPIYPHARRSKCRTLLLQTAGGWAVSCVSVETRYSAKQWGYMLNKNTVIEELSESCFDNYCRFDFVLPLLRELFLKENGLLCFTCCKTQPNLKPSKKENVTLTRQSHLQNAIPLKKYKRKYPRNRPVQETWTWWY
jgi:hypothetical protein